MVRVGEYDVRCLMILMLSGKSSAV